LLVESAHRVAVAVECALHDPCERLRVYCGLARSATCFEVRLSASRSTT